MYHQNYNPLGNSFLSTLIAASYIILFLYLLALHPHRDERGQRHLGIHAPLAAFFASLAALAISVFLLGMPILTALSSYVLGMLSSLIGIIWIIVGAMLLYTMTLITGKFEIVKESITHISYDRRLQVLLIAFSFGAIIEGTAGFGTPVAIAGAMMVGLGFNAFDSALLNLIANTAPVAYGAIGTPIITLGLVSDLPAELLSKMAGRQLPFVSVLVPFWLVATFVIIERGSWRDVWEVWPATLVAGGCFAIVQFLVSNEPAAYLLTDVVAGVAGVVALVLFLRVWHPKHRFLLHRERQAAHNPGPPAGPGQRPGGGGNPSTAAPAEDEAEALGAYRYTARETIEAWVPWVLLVVCVAVWGIPQIKAFLNNLIPGVTLVNVQMPFLHNLVQRTPPIAPPDAKPEAAVWAFNWLSASGTGVVVAALLSGLWLRLSPDQWRQALTRTAVRLKTPVMTILQVLGLGFLTRYSGLDAIIGLAFTNVGVLYPFFAALLGWLGVFMSGSDTASNALFGSLQKITAQQLNLNPVLITASNSTGGVMGKMIDAQSILVATAACYEDPREGSDAVGPIFRSVLWHSIALASIMGVIVMLQAYVVPWMIPSS